MDVVFLELLSLVVEYGWFLLKHHVVAIYEILLTQFAKIVDCEEKKANNKQSKEYKIYHLLFFPRLGSGLGPRWDRFQ